MTYRVGLLLLALAITAPGHAWATDACAAAFTWDVATERALFSGASDRIVAGQTADAAPVVRLAHPYTVALGSQQGVAFVTAPARKPGDEAHAGLLRLRLDARGRYRVSLDAAAWIDVAVAGAAVAATDFQGGHGCNAPHKIVEFELPAGDALIQLSASPAAELRLAVTRSPAPPRAPRESDAAAASHRF